MNLITLGSKFLDDAIVYNSEELHNKLRIVGISPFALSDIPIGCVDGKSYETQMFNIESSSSLGRDISTIDYDYFIIDFLMACNRLYSCSKNGTERFLTKSPYLDSSKKLISGKLQINFGKEINPLSFSDKEIRERINNFYKYLMLFIPQNKLVLLKWQIPYQYVDGEKIVNDEFDRIYSVNIFLKKCEQYFQEISKCATIDMPKNTVRITSQIGARDLCLPEHSKNYLASMILDLSNGRKRENEILEEYELAHEVFISNFQRDKVFFLKDFVGEYQDCFGNFVTSKSKCNFEIGGHNSMIFIKEVRADRLSIVANDNCYIEIGTGTTFADHCKLIADGHKIILGKDDMFSTEVICNAIEDDIIIGEHVWIGYQACVEGGTKIGNGSIVGARTVISGTVPNNCIVVGKDGRIVRKDIYWEREPYTDFIEKAEYAHFTEE